MSFEFSRWLRAQADRADWIGDLARAAMADPRFPWTGEPPDMMARVRSALGGDGETLHAFRAALDEWHGAPYSLHEDNQARSQAERTRAIQQSEALWAAEAEKKRASKERALK